MVNVNRRFIILPHQLRNEELKAFKGKVNQKLLPHSSLHFGGLEVVFEDFFGGKSCSHHSF